MWAFQPGTMMADFLHSVYASATFQFFDAFGSRIVVYSLLFLILRNVWRGGNRYTRKSDVAGAFKRAETAESVLEFIGWTKTPGKNGALDVWESPTISPDGWLDVETNTVTKTADITHDVPIYFRKTL